MLGRKRNALRRGSDRLEAALLLILFVLFVLGAPVLAWWASGISYRSDLRAMEWERRHVFRVQAELVAAPMTVPESRTAAPRLAQAVWTAPDGTPRNGSVEAVAGQRPGDRVQIWVDDRGEQRGRPLDRNPVGQAALIAVVVVVISAVVLNALRRLGLAVLERHRARAWQREWLEFGPRWSRDLLP